MAPTLYAEYATLPDTFYTLAITLTENSSFTSNGYTTPQPKGSPLYNFLDSPQPKGDPKGRMFNFKNTPQPKGSGGAPVLFNDTPQPKG
jgi:hypothetical protein